MERDKGTFVVRICMIIILKTVIRDWTMLVLHAVRVIDITDIYNLTERESLIFGLKNRVLVSIWG